MKPHVHPLVDWFVGWSVIISQPPPQKKNKAEGSNNSMVLPVLVGFPGWKELTGKAGASPFRRR